MTGKDTLVALVAGHASSRGDAPAIREKSRGIWRTWTWRDVQRDSERLAASFAARGLRPGDRVALLSDNRPNLFIATLAAQRLGAIAAPLFQDADGEEVTDWLSRLAPRFVYAENQEQVDKVLALLDRVPSIELVVHDRERGLSHYRDARLASVKSLMAQGEGQAAPPVACAASDPAFVFFSAGTDGVSRGVVHGHGALLARAAAATATDGFGPSDTTMAYLSPGWSCSMILTWVVPVATGGCLCCPEASDTLLTDLREIAPTRFLGTPRVVDLIRRQVVARMAATGGLNERLFLAGMARMRAGAAAPGIFGPLVFAPLRDFLGMSRIRSAYAVGDTMDPETLAFFRAIGVSLKKLYGTTETGYFDAMLAPGGVADSLGTALRGSALDLSPQGEVLVKSDGMFLGYLGDPDARDRAVGADGWFHTGDHGVRLPDGSIALRDRMGDIGRFRDGSPFSPKQVERRLVAQPEIAEAVAIGEGRDGVFALIDIDAGEAARWADSQGIASNGHADLAAMPGVAALVGAAVARVNEGLEAAGMRSHRIARFVLLPDPLTPASGMLTPTGKVRRGTVERHFGAAIAAFDAGRSEATVPGADGTPRGVTLHDAGPAGASGTRRVA